MVCKCEVCPMNERKKVVSIEDRIPKLKQQRRKKANQRLIFLLLLFFLLIACILYFQSPLSHVQKVHITGNRIYSDEEIIVATKINSDTNIWSVDKEAVENNVNELVEIKQAEVQIALPSTVQIEVQELKRIAYFSQGNHFFPVLENGNILSDRKIEQLPLNAPILFNFIENNVLKEMIAHLEKLPEEVFNSISEIHYDPTESDEYHIFLYMNDGNSVSATIRTFSEKMVHYPSIVSQLEPNQKGVINLEVGSYFKAYEIEGDEPNEVKEDSEG
jgi:cell division protein FtsQ